MNILIQIMYLVAQITCKTCELEIVTTWIRIAVFDISTKIEDFPNIADVDLLCS